MSNAKTEEFSNPVSTDAAQAFRDGLEVAAQIATAMAHGEDVGTGRLKAINIAAAIRASQQNTSGEIQTKASGLSETAVSKDSSESAAPTYYGKDCPQGMVQIEFVGCDPALRYSNYGWKPVKSAFLEVYIDGKRYRVDVGNFHDGIAQRRGLHIVGPIDMRCEMTSINACSVFCATTQPEDDRQTTTEEQHSQASLPESVQLKIAETRERRAAISPAPWQHMGPTDNEERRGELRQYVTRSVGCGDVPPEKFFITILSCENVERDIADAAFIANAPTDIDYLLSIIDSLQTNSEVEE